MEDPLPRLGIRDVDHPAKNPSVGWRAEDSRTENAIEVLVAVRVVAKYQLLGGAAELLADVHVEAALPITVAESGGRRCDRELVWHEVIVRHRVRGKVSEVAKRESAERFRLGIVVDLESNGPRVAMPSRRRVLLGDAGVGGNGAVEKIVRICRQQLGDAGRKQGQ